MENRDRFSTYFLFGGIGILGALAVLMALPYLGTLALAAAASVIFEPLYRRFLNAKFVPNRALAAALTVAFVIIAFLIVLGALSLKILQEAQGVYATITSPGSNFNENIRQIFERLPQNFFPEGQRDPARYIQQAFSWIFANFGSVFSGTLEGLIKFFIGLIAFYYFLKDGGRFLENIIKWSPLSEAQGNRILNRMQAAVNAVIKGSLTVALIQGFLSGVGYLIFHVPNPVLWGAVTAVSALIPGVGTATVLVPAIVFLFVTGKFASGIGLIIWGGMAVGLIDNFLGPKVMERGIKIHPFLILLSVLGGVGLFGPTGFVLGPLALSLLFALLETYSEIKSEVVRA